MLSEKVIREQIHEAVEKVKQVKPMAPSITNTVTINLVANTQLAVGGSAAMVYLPDEGEALAEIAESFYINVGTLLPVYTETLPRTARRLHERKKNWVLDPVAVGLGAMRTELLSMMKPFKPSVIRGNASEVITLAKLWGLVSESSSAGVKGVDSTDAVSDAENAAIELAKYTGGAVAVSGEEDLITDGTNVMYVKGGSHFMEKITGAGCSLGGVIAVYAAVTDPFTAAVTGSIVYDLAGQLAEKKSDGPGSFQVNFLDELYKASAGDLAEYPFSLKN